MGNASTSVATVTVASAAILTFSLVTASPDIKIAKAEVRAVQIDYFATRFISIRTQDVLPLIPAIDAGAADIPGAAVATPLKFVQALPSAGAPTQATQATAHAVNNVAVQSRQDNFAAAAAAPDFSWLLRIAEALPASLRGAFFFFVVIPVFYVLRIFYPSEFPDAVSLPETAPTDGVTALVATDQADATVTTNALPSALPRDSSAPNMRAGDSDESTPVEQAGDSDESTPVEQAGDSDESTPVEQAGDSDESTPDGHTVGTEQSTSGQQAAGPSSDASPSAGASPAGSSSGDGTSGDDAGDS